jgi:hypothetical protein
MTMAAWIPIRPRGARPVAERGRWRSVAAALLCLALACTTSEPPGALVGAYHIDGQLLDNSCGKAALPAAEALKFDVEVRRDDQGRGIWRQATPPARFGQLDEDGAFSFELETSYQIDLSQGGSLDQLAEIDPERLTDPELVERLDSQSVQTCTLNVRERIGGMLVRDSSATTTAPDDDTQGQADLVADSEIEVRAAAGSYCAPVLAVYGGPFEELPCSATYALEGTLAERQMTRP